MKDIDQKLDIAAGSREPIICQTYLNQEAGEYTFSEYTDPGLGLNSIRTKQTSFFTGQNYTQRIIPKINTMSSHQGSGLGHKLTVTGTGFSSDESAYECSIAGETCTVTAATISTVSLEVPVKNAANTVFGQLTQEAGDATTQIDGFDLQ